ncbi:hypothetical protein CCAX7_61900 [Capsulimonas corticalis]|uniref:Uncharacterized protein n=1 Tax=Capsulimonas corticalis TaxID=2219043 RepID=A0A402CWH6_9BACT|nr:CRISPR-associated helicase Cas3' [Capsulimonas corticalis]BDI34139.1 hypothetical protein CCAX7_61900 [Capsulimonas corticalis]
MTYLAKPSGITLEVHVADLEAQCDVIFPNRSFTSEKYRRRTGGDLEALTRLAVKWHDEGKKCKPWQDACRRDYEYLQLTKKQGTVLRNAKIRHELASLEFIHKAGIALPDVVRVAIAAHHRKLSRRHEHRWGEERSEFGKFWKEFTAIADGFRIYEIERALETRYRYAGPRSLLQLADHRASAIEGGSPVAAIKPFEYNFPYNEKRGVQAKIEELKDEAFAILRAPTGSGKTDAALLWAKHKIEKGLADRLIIAMPTRFTASALASSNVKQLSQCGLYHSTAWLKPQSEDLDLARTLDSSVTVTTIDHLCISLTGTREDHHAIFFNLMNSCVVIDEADFYDDFTQHNIVALLRALRQFDVPVLLMSATAPDSARHLYSLSGFTVEKIHEDLTDYDRVRCHLTRLGKSSHPEDIASHLQRALDGEATIIYTNTVARAQEYYDWFQKSIRTEHNLRPEHVVLYHSRFLEHHKAQKEELLYQMLGREAWKQEAPPTGVAILTQIGELSVNISADLMISDLCPVDRLTQRAGRLARFYKDRVGELKEKRGELFIVDPYQDINDDSIFYPAPYGTYVMGSGWRIGEALSRSAELVVDGEYTAHRFVDLVNEVYPTISAIAPHVRDNCRELETCIVGNWLILPKAEAREDDDETKDWRSRDIAPQTKVYAEVNASGVESDGLLDAMTWNGFRRFQLDHGIECPQYRLDAAIKAGILNKDRDHVLLTVGEETIEIWTVPPARYCVETGLSLGDKKTS